MNFLAHVYLAEPRGIASPLALVGNLMPDLVRGRLPRDLPPDVAAGVTRHRKIDLWTDTHPAFAATRDRIKPTLSQGQGRFAGVVADVLFDHALCQRWADYHPTPLPMFITPVYERLTDPAVVAVMPPRMRAAVALMAQQDWLGRYATEAGLRATFAQMSARFADRFGREIDLTSSLDRLAAQRPALLDDFDRLFPDLVARCRALDAD